MATVKPIKSPKRKPWRAGTGDPLDAHSVESLYALARTLVDLVADADYVDTRSADHKYWLRVALAEAIEERCERMVKAEQLHEDREREYQKPSDAVPTEPERKPVTSAPCPVCAYPISSDEDEVWSCDRCDVMLHGPCYWGRIATLEEWVTYIRTVLETDIDSLTDFHPDVVCAACRQLEGRGK